MPKIPRTQYLDFLLRHRDKPIIKVVTGVRRCGKSTLFDIYRNYLLSHGVSPQQITMINFEDVAYEHLLDYHTLYQYIVDRLLPDQMNYIFLDEIQHVSQYEKAVDSLFLKENCDVYITGSNAYFLSGDLATQLSGRYVELSMLPLSFQEFCLGLTENRQSLSNTEKFNLYLQLGGFPFLVSQNYGPKEAQEYLRGIYDTVLLNDIVQRKRISDVSSLSNVTKFLLYNIGNRVSPAKISNTLKSAGNPVDPKTVARYLEGLTEALLFYQVPRYNIRGKQFLTQQNKLYVTDIGLRNVMVRSQSSDIGHILENIVYLELLRRGYQVCTGQLDDDKEIDFVAIHGDSIAYYQVSASTLDESTLQRELAPFEKVRDHYPKYLLTLDEVFREANYNGVQKLNVIDWLLSTP